MDFGKAGFGKMYRNRCTVVKEKIIFIFIKKFIEYIIIIVKLTHIKLKKHNR